MATVDLFKREEELFSSIFDLQKGEAVKSHGQLIEKKIDILEGLAEKVSNRRSRRWMNDRLLIELVPHLNANEIRGLFAPPPWGEETPVSAFSMTNVGEWDPFRNIDMDLQAKVIKEMEKGGRKEKSEMEKEKMVALKAWRRIDRSTRAAIRRHFLPNLVLGFEGHIRDFINQAGDSDVLVLHVQDPLHRLLLHGVCQFYNVTSVTETITRDGVELQKTTTIKKKAGVNASPPNISLVQFLTMARQS